MVKSQPSLRYIWRAIPALVIALALSACTNTGSHQAQTYRSAASQDEFEAMVRNLDIKSKLMDQYASWKGVRYRLGGDSRKGIDCSAFVQRTFREQFGMELPRSTYEQQESGIQVQRGKLRPGDLVLFRAGSTGRHVGIVHAGNLHTRTGGGRNKLVITNVDAN
ncbi:bifunctional murein DD-endopeptidase/murein LD-carboxypeptidase, partial [Symbiopectobacterium sp.]|uniref:bifunctional murein DD-endopeptidase/murein LD-carboxypeptidase n=1 Tax=Symbiopectobacterium sp. TaxID=2952789 RepID=UPI003F2D72C2